MSAVRPSAVVLCIVLCGVPAAAQSVLPEVTLAPGEKFFRLDGTPLVLLGTNPTGFREAGKPDLAHFEELLPWASINERIVRIHLTNGRVPRPARAGDLDVAWAEWWDDVFDLAYANGLWVLPVFEVWADWSTRNPPTSSTVQTWANNPYNVAKGIGGVAANPVELLDDTPTRALWLTWLRQLVDRWKDRPNILGWEVFSELDLITYPAGLSEDEKAAKAAAFVQAARDVIHDAEGPDHHRPITASMAGANDWPLLSTSAALDFIQVHPYGNAYGYQGNLDQLILDKVRERLALYGKPVMIGESGLDSNAPVTFNTREMSPNAHVGINHAIWAGAVSGSMTARMLWFEDGYDRFHFIDPPANTTRLDLRSTYKDASAPVARFLEDVDYSGFAPIAATLSSGITGAALGNESLIVAWVRDTLSAASADWPAMPGWPATAPLGGQTVTVAALGHSHTWLVTFYDTGTGEVVHSEDVTQAADGAITVALPSFTPSIALQIRAIRIVVDIKPDDRPNAINPASGGVIPVAILTTQTVAGDLTDFDAAAIDPSTLQFGPSAATPRTSRLADVDRDGDLDLLLHVATSETGFACGDTIGTVTGATREGRAIAGSDAVTIVGGACR